MICCVCVKMGKISSGSSKQEKQTRVDGDQTYDQIGHRDEALAALLGRRQATNADDVAAKQIRIGGHQLLPHNSLGGLPEGGRQHQGHLEVGVLLVEERQPQADHLLDDAHDVEVNLRRAVVGSRRSVVVHHLGDGHQRSVAVAANLN